MRDSSAAVATCMALPPAQTMEQIVAETVQARKFQTMLAAIFAVAALLLASLGIYGVISFAVARRTPEIGIRIALGASRGELLGLIFREGMTPVIAGLAAGLIGAASLGRVIASQLYGVMPRDPWTMAVVALTVIAVAVLACLIPARRATRIDPLAALRFE
jgi:putative ABC transport system permease protein